MKTITLDDALTMGWCYPEEKLRKIAGDKKEWTALDILRLPERVVGNEDRLYAVLNERLIDAAALHEFACRCAERALARLDNPDPRSIAAIEAKRAWLRGEISGKEMAAAWSAAWDDAGDDARDAAWATARAAAWGVAWGVARAAAWGVAGSAARDAERKWQVEELTKMLEEEEWEHLSMPIGLRLTEPCIWTGHMCLMMVHGCTRFWQSGMTKMGRTWIWFLRNGRSGEYERG